MARPRAPETPTRRSRGPVDPAERRDSVGVRDAVRVEGRTTAVPGWAVDGEVVSAKAV